MSFKDDHPEMQHLAREYVVLRNHNLKFRPDSPQDALLMFAEAAVCMMVIERFLRILLAERAGSRTLEPLVRLAVKQGLLVLPNGDATLEILKAFRNAMLHADFERLAARKSMTFRQYFKTAFATELEQVGRVVDQLVDQVDPTTGKPKPRPTACGTNGGEGAHGGMSASDDFRAAVSDGPNL